MLTRKVLGVLAGAVLMAGVPAGTAGAATTDAQTRAASSQAAVVQDIRGDGCTGVPDSYLGANFRPACDRHDACYSKGSTTDRKVCDVRLHEDLRKACANKFGKWNPLRYSCYDMASKYYLGVRALGKSHYEGSGDPS